MYTRKEDVEALEGKYGSPRLTEMAYEIKPWEYDVVEGSMRHGRAHDVTLFIRKKDDPEQVALITKPFFPPGAWRAPSGAANRGESLEHGALREGLEETGLEIELERYIVRISARFTCGQRSPIDWTTHVFEAREVSGVLDPQDTVEIADARWASLDELQGAIRAVLLEAGWDLFRYRVALTDLTVEAMEVGP